MWPDLEFVMPDYSQNLGGGKGEDIACSFSEPPIDSHLLLASTSFNLLLRRGSEKEASECPPFCHLSPNLVNYNHEVASIPFGERLSVAS